MIDQPIKSARISRVDEAWYLLEGEIQFDMAEPGGEWRRHRAQRGDFVFAPAGTRLHVWRTSRGAARFLYWTSGFDGPSVP